MKYLDKNELEYLLGIEDLSKNKNHSIGLIVNNIYDKLNSIVSTRIVRKSPITTKSDNYDRLYYPSTDITRNSVYTRWIDDNRLLRTHTTSMIIEELENWSNGEE